MKNRKNENNNHFQHHNTLLLKTNCNETFNMNYTVDYIIN
jgi:hypothetical protein